MSTDTTPEQINEICRLIDRTPTSEMLMRVNDSIRRRLDDLARRAARSYRVGDAVMWKSEKNGGVTYRGKVIKINPKMVRVEVKRADGSPMVWNVSGSLLRRDDSQQTAIPVVKP